MPDNQTSISPDGVHPQLAPQRKHVLLKWSLLATGLLLTYGMWQCGSGLVQGGRASDAAVADFHHTLNDGSFGEIYSQSDQVFQQSDKKEELFKFFARDSQEAGECRQFGSSWGQREYKHKRYLYHGHIHDNLRQRDGHGNIQLAQECRWWRSEIGRIQYPLECAYS